MCEKLFGILVLALSFCASGALTRALFSHIRILGSNITPHTASILACVRYLAFCLWGGGTLSGERSAPPKTEATSCNYWPPPPPHKHKQQEHRRPSFGAWVASVCGFRSRPGVNERDVGAGCALCGGPRGCASAEPSYARASRTREAPAAVLVHEPRHVHHNDVALWDQGAAVAGLPSNPKGRARPLELRFSSSLSSPPAPLPVTRRVPLLASASGAMTLLWRCTKSAASVLPCVVLILSLMYA